MRKLTDLERHAVSRGIKRWIGTAKGTDVTLGQKFAQLCYSKWIAYILSAVSSVLLSLVHRIGYNLLAVLYE